MSLGKNTVPPMPPMPWDTHKDCTWEQVGPCVYCTDHNERLYQGDLPEARRTTPKCTEHRWDDGDSMCQSGFYFLCLDCGEREWT